MGRITAIGSLLLLLLGGCAPYDVTSRYATLEEAKADRLFERGWLPDVLPTSATQIRTENDLDLNISEGEFSFAPADANALFERLSKGAPPTSRLDDWQETVDSYVLRGYSTWSFHDEDSTWAFFCTAQMDRCEYLMWPR